MPVDCLYCFTLYCFNLTGCYRTRLGSTDRLRRHIILRWGNRNVVTRDTRKATSRLRRKGKQRRWKGHFVGAKTRIRRLHFNCLVEQYKLNDDVLLFFRSCGSRVRSFGMIRNRITDPRSLGSRCIRGSDKSTLGKDFQFL